MGQKVNPIGFRLAVNKDWRSRWFGRKKDFGIMLSEDILIRDTIKKKLQFAGIPRITIERYGNRVRVNIFSARPGIVIGRKGTEIDRLRDELQERTGKEIVLDVTEVKKPELEAQLVAENIALQLRKRVSFRRAMKRAVSFTMDAGAEGVKILCSGRLGGSEIARSSGYREGKIPLHTLRADIDYGFAESRTTYGQIGVKVWIYKGEKAFERGGSRDGSATEKV